MKYIFTNGHILDGTKDMKVLDGHSVLVEEQLLPLTYISKITIV